MADDIDNTRIFNATYADGDYNSELEVEATDEGLLLYPLAIVIPWEWISAAQGRIQSQHLLEKQPLY